MKKLNLITFMSLSLLAFLFMSNVGGRANIAGQGATGAPTEGTCGNNGCHDDGQFTPGLELSLVDADGNDVAEYFPGTEYFLNVVNTATGASAYGFQVTSLNGDDDYFGDWEALSANTQVTDLTNRTYFEHAGASTNNAVSAKWSNAEVSAGNITFYASSVAINANGNPNGDGTALATLEVPIGVLSNKNLAEEIELVLSPNPTSGFLNVTMDGQFESIEVLNILGKKMLSSKSQQIDLSAFANGTYLVKVILKDNKIATKKILKI